MSQSEPNPVRVAAHVELLFNKMDTNVDARVEWDEFCTYMMNDMHEKEEITQEAGVQSAFVHVVGSECGSAFTSCRRTIIVVISFLISFCPLF